MEIRGEAKVSGAPGSRELAVLVEVDGGGEPRDQLALAFERLRVLSAREHLRPLGCDVGFRLEDLRQAAVRLPAAADAAFAERWLRRRLPAAAALAVGRAAGPGTATALRLEAVVAERAAPLPGQPRYALRADGRIGVEAFELHVVEHCNLRCAHCCNMSPFLPRRVLEPAAAGALLGRLAQTVHADVFKIMGGEPLLHPDLAGVLRAVKASGISPVVRLFTNGLLLHRVGADAWREIDHLTISTYTSAPASPQNLALARAKARELGIVLNVKEVAAFSEVLSPRRSTDASAVRETYRRCWLRHRCLVVRAGTFFKCTRAAYAEEFLARVQADAPPADFPTRHALDGVPLDAPDFRDRLLAYLNRPEPLAACDYCFGGDGPLAEHEQLSADDVRKGRTRATRASGARP